jgi:exosortase
LRQAQPKNHALFQVLVVKQDFLSALRFPLRAFRSAPCALRFALAALPLAWLWGVLILQLRIPWSMNPQYAYGWAVPFLCLYLIWQRVKRRAQRAEREAVGRESSRAARGGISAFSFQLSAFAFFALLYAPTRLIQEAIPGSSLVCWPLALIVITLTLCALHLALGAQRVAQLAFPLCFFLVAVPWPYVLENPVIQGLTRLNTALTVEVLGWLGIPAMPRGNVIELATGFVGIDEACSGIRSLQATLMISLFLGELYRLTTLRRVILCLSGFGIAMVCNLARMLLLTWVASRQGVEAIEGWHDPAGVSILVGCFLGLWLLGVTLRAPPRPSDGRGVRGEGNERGQGEVSNSPVPTLNPNPNPNLSPGDSPDTPPSLAREVSPALHRALAREMASPIPPGRPPSSNPAATLAFSLQPSAFLLLWLLLVEIGVAAWYRHVEANLPAQATWQIAWPEAKAGFREVPIGQKATQMLRYDEARQVHWMEADGTPWQLSWFYWKAGRTAGYLAKTHNPLVCMPAAGYEVVSVLPIQFANLHGLQMPFRIYRFQQEGSVVYVLYSRWEDRALEQSFASEGVTRFNRLQSVWRGRGIHGQRVISLALWGASDPEQARDRLLRQLETLVIADRP